MTASINTAVPASGFAAHALAELASRVEQVLEAMRAAEASGCVRWNAERGCYQPGAVAGDASHATSAAQEDAARLAQLLTDLLRLDLAYLCGQAPVP